LEFGDHVGSVFEGSVFVGGVDGVGAGAELYHQDSVGGEAVVEGLDEWSVVVEFVGEIDKVIGIQCVYDDDVEEFMF
jgi:hypothetical protein